MRIPVLENTVYSCVDFKSSSNCSQTLGVRETREVQPLLKEVWCRVSVPTDAIPGLSKNMLACESL